MIGNGNLEQNFKTYYVKLRGTTEGEKPHFEFKHKVGDEYEIIETDRPITQFSAVLQKVTRHEREYKGDLIVSNKLTFVDEDSEERYVFEINHNAFWREMVNRMANLVSKDGGIHFLKMGVYSGPYEDKEGNPRESRGFFVHSDMNKGEHEVSFSSLTNLIDVATVGKKEVKSMDRMNDHFEKMLDDVVIPAISVTPVEGASAA